MFDRSQHPTKRLFSIFAIVSICSSITSFAAENTYGGNMFARFSVCRNALDENKRDFTDDMLGLIPGIDEDQPRGRNGVIGILGGITDTAGPLYFAGMGALRMGADEVHVYIINSDRKIPYICPDFVMHHHIPNNIKPMLEHMNNVDVIVLGPGLERIQHSREVVNEVIRMCKKNKKPLILDLSDYFYAEGTIFKILADYPEPGAIVMLNSQEFEKIYPFIKMKEGFSDAHVNIDFDSLGPNLLIYRKGCVDMAFTKYPANSWSYTNVKFEENTKTPKLKRSKGQGSVIAGMTATYFNWVLKDNNTWMEYDYIMRASAATYASANVMRRANALSFEKESKGALTSDMVDCITEIVHTNAED